MKAGYADGFPVESGKLYQAPLLKQTQLVATFHLSPTVLHSPSQLSTFELSTCIQLYPATCRNFQLYTFNFPLVSHCISQPVATLHFQLSTCIPLYFATCRNFTLYTLHFTLVSHCIPQPVATFHFTLVLVFKMKFTKMHGIGNDYVYIDCFANPEPANLPKLAEFVSHRHFGIGSDGLVLIRPAEGFDAEMVMYNPDGTISEMCGNALRCVSKFVHDHGYAPQEKLTLKTGAGTLYASILRGPDGKAQSVRIDMGAPILAGLKIPTVWDREPVLNQEITALDRTFLATCVSMGNPHCVIFVDDVANFPVEKYGPVIENSLHFPRRVNVEFVQVVSRTELIQRTWERGAGETWACGTGASAVCVAGVLTGSSDPQVRIHLLGGDLELHWLGEGKSVFMTGGATEVFSGELDW